MLPALSLLPSSSTSSSSKLSSMRPFQTPASKHLLLRTNKSPDFQSKQLQTAKANHLETTSPLPLITISTAIKAPLSIQLRSAYYRQHSFTVWSYNSHQSLFSCCITGALKVLQILDSCPMPKRFWSDGCSGISRPMGFFNMCLVCIWCTPSPQRSPLPLSGFRSGSWVQLTGGAASQPGGGGAIGYWRPFQPSQLLHLLSSAFKWVESNTRTLYSLPSPPQPTFNAQLSSIKSMQEDLFPCKMFPHDASWCHPLPGVGLNFIRSRELLKIALKWLRPTVQHWTGQVLQNWQVWLHWLHSQQCDNECFLYQITWKVSFIFRFLDSERSRNCVFRVVGSAGGGANMILIGGEMNFAAL